MGELDVTIPHHLLRNTRTHENSISFCYTYKFVKAALSGVPGMKAEYNSQISIDANGLLKVRPSPTCAHTLATSVQSSTTEDIAVSEHGTRSMPCSSVCYLDWCNTL